MNQNHQIPPTILVIFGITGDLSHRYLLPALSKVAQDNGLPANFKIIGVSRRPITNNDLFRENEQGLGQYGEALQIDLDALQDYQTKLKDKISAISSSFSLEPQIIYYLSVPPNATQSIIKNLGESGLNTPETKLLQEKPFGIDYESAKYLINETAKYFAENQIYRIDHYLAKAMVQDIIVFLGSNTLFKNSWNNTFIEKIEIEASEQISIENRVKFYDSTGALRDILQNHLLQLTAVTLMEPISQLSQFSELPTRRLEVLKSLKIAQNIQVVRGQYKGYRDEVGNPNSATETFVSLAVESINPKWAGVPIQLFTGKSLKEKLSEIRVYFKKVDGNDVQMLKMRIQPNEGIELLHRQNNPTDEKSILNLHYNKGGHPADAYEQVLVDAMQSNHSLFVSGEEVLASWKVVQDVQAKWATANDDLVVYNPGSTAGEVLALAKS